MSNVVDSVEASFKALVAQRPYRSVTVKEICEGAFISRRTFYANFVDKRAVVAYLFRRDSLNPVTRSLDLLELDEVREVAPIVFTRFFQGVLDNADYYTDLVRPMAGNDPTFELVAARAVYGVITGFVKKHNPSVDAKLLDAVAFYHSAGCSIFLERWICNEYDKQPAQLGEMQANLVVDSIGSLVKGSAL